MPAGGAGIRERLGHGGSQSQRLASVSSLGNSCNRTRHRLLLFFARLSSVRLTALLLLASLLLRWADNSSRFRRVRGNARSSESECASLRLKKAPVHSREIELRDRYARRLSDTSNPAHIRVWQLSEYIFPRTEGKKLVALVELKNVASVLPTFLKALAPLVDSIVVLDDLSTDETRVHVLEAALSYAPVEILINKSGDWVREEMLDRNILLRYGRYVGGSHFVLPDYDEYFSSNCIVDGSLRKGILSLEPGESLALPWVEAWKSLNMHRVLPTDSDMNFLTRRQTIIFADDGVARYDPESSNSRSLGTVQGDYSSSERDASIHVLRCPRSICPPPPRYHGSGTPISPGQSVKTLPHCRIIELRFLSTANVLLKAAWYEALGRVMGVSDSITRGKMLDSIFPEGILESKESNGKHVSKPDEVVTRPLDPQWLDAYSGFEDESLYKQVERWRARDIIRWRGDFGDSHFIGLPAYRRIDISALDSALRDASGSRLHFVPQRRSRGTFVVALDDDGVSLMSAIGVGKQASRSATDGVWIKGTRLGRGEGEAELGYENWRGAVLNSVQNAVDSSRSAVGYCSAVDISRYRLAAFLEMAAVEMPYIDLVVFSTTGDTIDGRSASESENRQEAFTRAMEPGSNVRLVMVKRSALGSLAALAVVCERILGAKSCVSEGGEKADGVSWSGLLSFAEKQHPRQHSQALQTSVSKKLKRVPVARLMFSLNVGRSGSKYLSSIFGSCGNPGILSVHEPRCPEGFCSGGGAVRMQSLSLHDSYEKRLSVKVALIRKAVSAAVSQASMVESVRDEACDSAPERLSERYVLEISGSGRCVYHHFSDVVYSETNPNFKAWFYDVVLDTMPAAGYTVDVIVLRRYIPAVVQSLFSTGYFSDRDGYNWMETANGVNSLIKPLDADDKLDAYDKLISYVLNAEAVTRQVMRRYAKVARFFEVRSEDVYGWEGALKLVKALGLQATEETLEFAGRPIDKYSSSLKEAGKSLRKHSAATSLAECESRVRVYLGRCGAAGIWLPKELVHMDRWPGFEYHS